jgi:DNA-binding protein YbaB
MANPTLPNPQLAATARAIQRALDRIERGLLDVTFEGRVTGVDVVTIVDGRGHVVSLTVAPALIPSSGGSQADLVVERIRQTLDIALAAAKLHGVQQLATPPTLPNTGGQHPGERSGDVGGLVHDPHVGTAAQGQIEVRISLDMVPRAVTVAAAFFRSPDRLLLGDRVREAANIALTSLREEIVCASGGLAKYLVEHGL